MDKHNGHHIGSISIYIKYEGFENRKHVKYSKLKIPSVHRTLSLNNHKIVFTHSNVKQCIYIVSTF